MPKRSPQRQNYRLDELKRWGDYLNIKINLKPKFFPPKDPHLPAKFVIAAILRGNILTVGHECLKALWCDEMDISDMATLKKISNKINLEIDFNKELQNEKINSNVISYFNHLKKLIRENKIEGITNLTPSYNKLIISFDLSITNFKKITKILENLKIINNNQQNSKKIKIPMCCDEEFALDLIYLSKKYNVLTEVGSKDAENIMSPTTWVTEINALLE